MSTTKLKVISINIEGDNHLDTVISFLKSEQADVVCLQEVLEKDLLFLKSELGMEGEYLPSMFIKDDNDVRLSKNTTWGVALLTKLPVSFHSEYYIGNKNTIPTFNGDPNSNNRVLVIGDVIKENEKFTIITTHFTWSPGGTTTQLQYDHLEKMFPILDKHMDFVLAGDFNAPRGKGVWQKIADKYKDNIPADIKTTIDPELHRVKNLQYVVDGLFSTKGIIANNLQIISGVSDHQALVGIISKA